MRSGVAANSGNAEAKKKRKKSENVGLVAWPPLRRTLLLLTAYSDGDRTALPASMAGCVWRGGSAGPATGNGGGEESRAHAKQSKEKSAENEGVSRAAAGK